MHQFVEYGLITEQQYQRAMNIAMHNGQQLGETLIQLGYVDERKIQRYCHRILGF